MFEDFNLTHIVTLIGEVIFIIGLITPTIVKVGKIANGTKCQLRHDMLKIYYANKDSETIRQYEYENFVFMYEAYKALKGNSFIDKIYSEVRTWEIIS